MGKGEFLFGRVQIVLGNSVKPGMRAISSVMLTFDALMKSVVQCASPCG